MEAIWDIDDGAWLVIDEEGHQVSPLFATELEARQWIADLFNVEEF